ncbi:MAG: hypothetical protein GWM92_13510, partial [Gemmatimonadetes bacterium]|nr:hypothetical protein [Gemmatimonadota bacterium]NIR79730.1 hypothetical protein [Gemmatimonadota bacterium]NIT88434.1 hypothetical protein [Gemmatimonadota bacterium]NIU32249.1 hypothetical protein [Gemmatimonadota bacterium]NIU36790.1 hypothetical protein [Gemmatimonadota bacterium]
VHKEVVAALGVPGVKTGVDLLGLHGGAPRSPLRPLPDAERERVEATLERAGLLAGKGAGR